MRPVTRLLLLLALALGVPGVGWGQEDALRWGRLTVVSDAPYDTLGFRESLELEGKLLQDRSLDRALKEALEVLASQGYPFAQAYGGSFDLDGSRVVGIIHLSPGVQARLEALVLEGAKTTRASTAERIAGVRPGGLYTGTRDRVIAERLARSGLFNSVGTPRIQPGLDPDAVLLSVPVSEPAYTRFGGLLGAGDAGVNGYLDLELRNIAGTAREGQVEWENRGDGLTRFFLRYREPWLPLVPVGLEGLLRHDINEGNYSFTKWQILGDIQWGGDWRFRFGRGGTQAVTLIPAGSDATGDTRTTESFFVAGVTLDARNSAINPTRGFLLRAESDRGSKTTTVEGDSVEVRFDRTRWRAGAEAFLPLGRNWLVSTEGAFLFLDTPEVSLPRWDQYEIGGARSVRGYREDQFLTRGALVSRNELRLLQGTRGSAIYGLVDVAFIQESGRQFRDLFDRFLWGAGVGVRQAHRLGILGVEYAVPRGGSVTQGRIHLRVDAVF